MTHRAGQGRTTPLSTYRVQLQPEFTFRDAQQVLPHLAALGVSHLYLSPILQASPGSTHGYDVVEHGEVNQEIGGRDGLEELAREAKAHGLGLIVDVVPNHMTTPTPAWLNTQWWSLLREGPDSPYASWFDVDWVSEQGDILVPVLGDRLESVLAAGDLVLAPDGGEHGNETVVRYFDHEFPVRRGTAGLPLPELLEAQHYRLAFWRAGAGRLNYRRFFDVSSLVAVRVEDPSVFRATHALFRDLIHTGTVDGLRIDHPDGLADPQGYLDRLAEATGDAWVVVEKILEGEEEVEEAWRCAGTTGYDALLRIGGLFVDPAGEASLTALWHEISADPRSVNEVVAESKALIVRTGQAAEVARLERLVARARPDLEGQAVTDVLEALLVAMPRYRAYAHPGREMTVGAREALDEAVAGSRGVLPPQVHDTLDAIAALAVGDGGQNERATADFVTRFQQTCGPVMAKGVEDTAFYRHLRLAALNEVGGDLARFGVSPTDLHAFAARRLTDWPTTMTTLSTHDTKRSEDVRARLAVLSELPDEWGRWLESARASVAERRGARVDGRVEYLIWQTLVGIAADDGTVAADRLHTYVEKSMREAKEQTTWTEVDADYEEQVHAFVDTVLGDAAVTDHVAAWLARTAAATRANILGQKLVQLIHPGVPDIYQGTQVTSLVLVDPDNRAPVDHSRIAARLAELDSGASPRDLDDEKLAVTAQALRVRRDHPEWFIGEAATWVPLEASTEHVFAVGRGDHSGVHVVALAARLTESVAAAGGWGDATITLPPGAWRDTLTGRETAGGTQPVGHLLEAGPVALLVRMEA
ncbi:malto-oligosyltrehalose synthase [Kribbia dieselivorans]|uniref:malto-oligosyltrehalose synthase n=1 Tax=Kribbia dieselivorans TaxID=331526 RepID=UPI000837BEBD|nr:malto-oligosyltrehalose synthase [Kribbia dieselivorans]